MNFKESASLSFRRLRNWSETRPFSNDQRFHVYGAEKWVLQTKNFHICNSIFKQVSTSQELSYLTRNSCLNMVRFCVNLSLFFESKLRVTSAINLSKHNESRWCWSAGCKMMHKRCHLRADNVGWEKGGRRERDRAKITFGRLSFNHHQMYTFKDTCSCNMQVTTNSTWWYSYFYVT